MNGGIFMSFITENLGTIAVLLVVIAVVGLIVYKMYKDKKAGKSSCGCKCSGCANAGACHASREKKDI